MTDKNNENAYLLRMNKHSQISVLQEIGFSSVTESTPAGDIAKYIRWSGGLLDLSFAGLLKNSLMLFLGYLPRSGLGLLWQLLYWGAVALFWPISSFVLILTSLWLPCLLSLMAIYPALEKSFDIEKKIKAIREAQLHGDDDQ